MSILVSTSCDQSTAVVEKPVDRMFQLLDSADTHIDFVNEVVDQENFNILTFRNYYNGGGVAIGDINNDGLSDIYFTANMSPNKLYLNKGDFVFEDITESAGVVGIGEWSTGVTMADVNADGWLDIYVCNSGDEKGENRFNELFINNGDGTFTDRARQYGLEDNGYTTHASFFDFDLDGDLDCFILNNSYTDPNRIATNASRARDNYGAPGGDRLYRNDDGQFVDVTDLAGIFSGDIDFGLGVSVGDINGDLYPDIYVSNDFWERDYLYTNNGDGTFDEVLTESMDYISANSMGADMADINNDGQLDIFSTDMLPATNYRMKSALKIEEYYLDDLKWKNSYFFQYVQNCLHINRGDGTFQESAFYSNVAATDWSWGALIFDMDNDGLKDIFVSNGIYHDITDLDFVDFLGDEENLKKVVKESGRIDFRDFAEYLPHNDQSNFAFINQEGNKFNNLSQQLGLDKKSYSNGSAYGDLDNDGDYDLVVNNVNMNAFIYRNDTKHNFIKIKLQGPNTNPAGIGSTLSLYTAGAIQTNQVMTARGFQSSVDPDVIFGLGNIKEVDSLIIIWPDGKKEVMKDLSINQTYELDYSAAHNTKTTTTATIPFFVNESDKLFKGKAQHVENDYLDFDHERLMPHMQSQEGPRMVVGDVNNDGSEDFFLLGAAGQSTQLYLYDGQRYELSRQEFIEMDKEGEDVCGALFDLDGDGDLDVMFGVGGNEYAKGPEFFITRTYINDGAGNFTRELVNAPVATGHIGCIKPVDFDNDGDMDVFIGGKAIPGAYGLSPRSYMFRNEGDNVWTDITTDETGPLGMVTDAVWTDINSDGWEDLIVVGEWMPVTVFMNHGDNLKLDVTIPNSHGWWNRIDQADLDGDGDMDYVLANWGDNMKFSASDERPLRIYIKDYDNNGRQEGIIEWFFGEDDNPYPFPSKMDLTAQLPSLKKKSIKYSEYATFQVADMFPPDLLMSAVQKEVNTFSTSILRRDGKSLVLEPMPGEAQMSPVFGISIADLDKDGILDIFLGGNFYGLKPEVGRHDGFKGGYFKGTGNGQFSFIEGYESGIQVKGEVRDAVYLNGQLLIARNDDSVLAFTKK